MDEETRAALARFERRIGNARELDRQAEALNASADALQKQLDNPSPDHRSLDPELSAIEIAELRNRAATLTQEADGIQNRLFEAPSAEMQKEIEDWANRRIEDLEQGRDRDRSR